ncbi:MAG TPA: ribonuclease HII [Kiloniellales bacterium]
MPDFAAEERLLNRLAGGAASGRIIGLDEAGRGPWAGPVTAAAVWLDPRRCPKALLLRIDDSKTFGAARRARVYRALREAEAAGRVAIGLGEADVGEIDSLNILRASLLAMRRAADDLARRARIVPAAAVVDGPHVPDLPYRAEALVGGDRLSLSVAAASIVAKVVRDGRMDELARRHPGYGWEHNRGYGTAAHRAALARLGVTPEHRRSFRPIRQVLELTL